MEKFSYDLTVALEETSLGTLRSDVLTYRRTRSTGNLPSLRRPTEDYSSSTSTAHKEQGERDPALSEFQSVHSDSDDIAIKQVHSIKNASYVGNFESDSVNEHFSPARAYRPNIRRKRKLKRMNTESEYEVTLHTKIDRDNRVTSLFGVTYPVKKKVAKVHEYRNNLSYCGKRKRSNRDRYFDNDGIKQHAFSGARQNNILSGKLPFLDHSTKRLSRPFGSKAGNAILPLNKSLIEKISEMQKADKNNKNGNSPGSLPENFNSSTVKNVSKNIQSSSGMLCGIQKHNFVKSFYVLLPTRNESLIANKKGKTKQKIKSNCNLEEINIMECTDFQDLFSSSSLSSSDSDDEDRNSNHEGDDELTDWPGSEACMFYDLKRKLTKKSFPMIKSEENDCDVRMSGDETMSKREYNLKSNPTAPIDIVNSNKISQNRPPSANQIESEMSGETSNPFMASPPLQPLTIREIRAGCRRIKEGRPSVSIKTSINERLAQFIQDGKQSKLRLSHIDSVERDSLENLAKLYSLTICEENGAASFTKTCNTTQSVEVDQYMPKCFMSNDYKRRCYGDNVTSTHLELKIEEKERSLSKAAINVDDNR